MKITSAEANKLLKKLEDNRDKLIKTESDDCTFRAAVGENVDDLRPDYVFSETQEALNAINDQIIKLKHAINVFNVTTYVKDGLTIDQALIKLPMLNNRKRQLNSMRLMSEKKRYAIQGNVIDYMYTSYDPAEAVDAYAKVSDEIDELQLALDTINHTKEFEF